MSDSGNGIPPQLLQRLLRENSRDKGVRISQLALDALSEYFRTFIREAIWRAAAETEKTAEKGHLTGSTLFLEVEDLEKIAPQLLLDF